MYIVENKTIVDLNKDNWVASLIKRMDFFQKVRDRRKPKRIIL